MQGEIGPLVNEPTVTRDLTQNDFNSPIHIHICLIFRMYPPPPLVPCTAIFPSLAIYLY